MTQKQEEQPNPTVKDNGNGTKTLTYQQTADQKRIQAASDKAAGKSGSTAAGNSGGKSS